MHYEVWAIESGNLIASPATEAEALALVRELLAAGWLAEDLTIGPAPDGDERADGHAPAVLSGAELAARAQVR